MSFRLLRVFCLSFALTIVTLIVNIGESVAAFKSGNYGLFTVLIVMCMTHIYFMCVVVAHDIYFPRAVSPSPKLFDRILSVETVLFWALCIILVIIPIPSAFVKDAVLILFVNSVRIMVMVYDCGLYTSLLVHNETPAEYNNLVTRYFVSRRSPLPSLDNAATTSDDSETYI
jgi:hypothetical protein